MPRAFTGGVAGFLEARSSARTVAHSATARPDEPAARATAHLLGAFSAAVFKLLELRCLLRSQQALQLLKAGLARGLHLATSGSHRNRRLPDGDRIRAFNFKRRLECATRSLRLFGDRLHALALFFVKSLHLRDLIFREAESLLEHAERRTIGSSTMTTWAAEPERTSGATEVSRLRARLAAVWRLSRGRNAECEKGKGGCKLTGCGFHCLCPGDSFDLYFGRNVELFLGILGFCAVPTSMTEGVLRRS